MSGLAEATAALREKDSEKTKLEEEIRQLEVTRIDTISYSCIRENPNELL